MEQRLSTKEDYLQRVNMITEYINEHLGENIDLEKLAERSHFSKWHFQRMMRAYLGEPIGLYIIRMRVETAAKLLRYSEMSISEIAYQVGYHTPSSLSKVFRLFYNISPSEYRNNKNFTIMKPIRISEDLNLKAPEIENLEPKQVIYVKLTGNYQTLDFDGAWGRLWQFVEENKLYSKDIEYIGMYHDDPKVTEESKLRTDICMTISHKVSPKGEIGVKTIDGGKYAKFSYTGPYENLGVVYDTIYSQWLPGNNKGYVLRDVPCFEKYINNPENTPPEQLQTEIYIPIK